jgi:hypothetical protein
MAQPLLLKEGGSIDELLKTSSDLSLILCPTTKGIVQSPSRCCNHPVAALRTRGTRFFLLSYFAFRINSIPFAAGIEEAQLYFERKKKRSDSVSYSV